MKECGSIRGWRYAAVRTALVALVSGCIAAAIFPGPLLWTIGAIAALFAMMFGAELCFLWAGWSPPRTCSFQDFRRRSIRLAAVLSVGAAIKFVWFSQYVISGGQLLSGGARADLLERRSYLLQRVATETFGPGDMPQLIESPFREELTIATLSMTTVALTNLAFYAPDTRIESRDAVARMIERMLSPEVRRYEVIWWGRDALDSLGRDEGQIGYLGHLGLMLGCYRLLGGDGRYDRMFDEVTSTLARRVRSGPGLHAETFPGAIFTADNTIVYVALRMHDLVEAPQYDALIAEWVAYSREHLLDSDSGMLRYHVDALGRATGTARGVLQAWNSMWLPLVDEAWAKEQYDRMRAGLMEQTLIGDFRGIREYPPGVYGPSDMVSGPIIFGVSSAATGFAIGGAVFWKDEELLTGLLRTAELAGGTVSWNGRRTYVLAPLVGEAIVLAAKSMYRWDARYSVPPTTPHVE